MRFRLRTLFFVVAAISVIASIAFYANQANQAMRNSYAVWWVADMVIEHMKANDGKWPRNWEDLRDDYQTLVQRSVQPWQFDELQHRVKIDWNVNPEELDLQADGSQEFRAIWLADGTDSFWEGAQPNWIILNYLR